MAEVLLHADYPRDLAGETTPRTLGDHDIVAFASLTGDYNRIHLDARQADGGRIAHGLLSAGWALGGLSQDAPLAVGRRQAQAWLHQCEVNYRLPVRSGDTLRCRWQLARQETVTQGFGAVRTDFQMLDQRDRAVTDGHVLLQVAATAGARLPASVIAPWPASVFRPEPGRVQYLEDFHPGSHAGETEGRTLTESDVVAYGGFSGDNGGHHGDTEFARAGLFGARIVQPMLAFDIGFALWLRDWCRMGTPDSTMAGHLCDRWTCHRPFHLGDTLRCRYQTLGARDSRSRPGMGLLSIGLQIVNQRQEVAMTAEAVMMYPARSTRASGVPT